MVGRVRRRFVCSACGRSSGQWAGRCPSCGGWGSVEEQAAPEAEGRGEARVETLSGGLEDRRIGTGVPGVDRVLGGGLVPGSVVLVAGAPGIGKSTLLLQLASGLSSAGHPPLLASGEESRPQVAARARRLGLDGAALRFVPGRDLEGIRTAVEAEAPSVLVVDSIQTVRDPASPTLPGGTAQVRACADAVVGLAKERDMAVLLVGHVTKEGDVAGPRALEHVVDAVLSFDGDPRSGLRVLTAGKNRFGPEGEVAWFEMGPAGVVETGAGSVLGPREREPGAATALALAGRRAVAVDVQALVVPWDGPPRRQVAGLDSRRFNIVAAVTERVSRAGLARAELYGATAGGMRVEDPGVDLAIAAALASSAMAVPPPPGAAFVGEVSLTGALRPVPGMEQRLSAAAGAGVEIVFSPPARDGSHVADRGIRLVPVSHLREALTWVFEPSESLLGAEQACDQRF